MIRDLEKKVAKMIGEHGWKTPTPIQTKALPHTLSGENIAGFAQTGTGKTGVFLITFAHQLEKAQKRHEKRQANEPFSLVICPTRELAIQITEDADKLFKGRGIRSLALYGGAGFEEQEKSLQNGVDLVVATPGRLLDFFEKTNIF